MSNVLLGIAAGAAWNLASFWCLIRLLGAWLGPKPSTKHAVAWLLVKFPLLYALIVLLFRIPSLSPAGFGAGFSLVLVIAVAVIFRNGVRSRGPSVYAR